MRSIAASILVGLAFGALRQIRTATCLNCEAALHGEYCVACGQRALDLNAPTWDVVRDAVSDATDFDGRVLQTLRALFAPGKLTLEFLRGKRAPYVGPLKLFLFAGAALSTTWVTTRGIDGHFYGYASDGSAARYIDRVVRGSLAAVVAIAMVSWALALGRRRMLDESVFALHLVAALSLLTSAVIWLATAWKLAWGTAVNVPSSMPALQNLLFFPALGVGLAYVVWTTRRVHGAAWWVTAVRALLLAAVGGAVVTAVIIGHIPMLG
jgi:Protein of unknown function (DUF3667)